MGITDESGLPNGRRKPRILIVTPEITYLPAGMGNMANQMRAKAGGLADVSASLISALFQLGADVHVALPHYRRMFHVDVDKLISNELRIYLANLSNKRIHLAQDRVFYYRDRVYGNYTEDSLLVSLAFQREVINNIIPRVNPDLIHCNDWMTGLIPAMARRLNVPCLFTVHNIHTQYLTLAQIEDRGIDAADFWLYLYYQRPPRRYEETRAANPVDLLTSGVFGAHFINTVSPSFLDEVADGRHHFIPEQIQREIRYKRDAGCAAGILNAPDPSYDPERDASLKLRYGPGRPLRAKAANRRALQEKLGLTVDAGAPVFFWPSRLDPVQKGCQLLAEILYRVVSDYWDRRLQLVIVANGSFQRHFADILHAHEFYDRVAVCDFEEGLSRLAYAGADFTLMPSRFEPCGLPQMIGPLYGSLPIVHATGGLRDTVSHLDAERGTGNGFVFEHYDTAGLRWAIDEAMRFHALADPAREAHVSRIMREARETFTHEVTAQHYVGIYEKMLQRPLMTSFG
ncbi:MAG: glycogen/starch synthase [Lentisphaeria bacterium]|nr:glycogen/starch synthase [Lentisphaeria bacterium]